MQKVWEKKLVHEIWFVGEFVPHLPWKACKPCKEAEPIEISKLCHVTHKKEATAIKTNGKYRFKAFPKKGKKPICRDGKSWGKTYKQYSSSVCELEKTLEKFEKLKINEQAPAPEQAPALDSKYVGVSEEDFLLPAGHYTWWSIDTPSARDKGSVYGSHLFSADFSYMIGQYCKRHTKKGQNPPSIILKRYGTLRYKREICYVIIVCADSDDLSEVKHLPAINHGEYQTIFSGLEGLDAEGKVPQPVPTITFKRRTYEEGWEHLTFAFYFSEKAEYKSFTLESTKVEYTDQIPHDKCIHKDPTTMVHNDPSTMKCPDKK